MAGVRVVTGDGGEARDTFVRGHPEGSVFHLAAFGRAVERTFGHRQVDLLALRDRRIVGVLPLGRVRSLLFGDRLVSVPFGVYGGPLAADREAGVALLDAAAMSTSGLRHVEVRCRRDGPPGWAPRRLYATFVGPLEASDEEFIAARPKETRRQIRIGRSFGLRPETGFGNLSSFYDLFERGYRDHGTPVFPRCWFGALRDALGEDCEIIALRDPRSGTVVAAVLCFCFRDEVQPFYVGTSPDWLGRKVTHTLYAEVARWARDRGAARFDFGRSKRGTGSFSFKCHWGFEEIDLDYRYLLVGDREVPDLSPLNRRYRVAIDVWRRVPLPVARTLGPLLVRGIG
ncbi:MAG: FemAB family PEP-CTERM system-associated protein [Planctomycetes bacterium]|jgi:FemAB-related protein (PEP-CTERM system-associated)|nr:FemAB family PEP-CTERM system-associated protein [Planctomycetota bacterium]